MLSDTISCIISAFKVILILIAIFYIGLYLWTVFHRIGYPFELEWMEGAMVDECRQLLSGNQLYRSPGLDYVPFIYPPGYFVVSAIAMRLFGVGIFAPRLVSLLASFGSMLLLFSIVKRDTGSYAAGIISAGLFAAAYAATGAWMDIARVDSLFLFWVVLGLFTVTRWTGSNVSAVITALIFSGAFFTKQVALAPALAVAVYYLIKERKQFILYVITMVIAAGGGTLWLNYYYRGWYMYYVFLLSSRHALQLSQMKEFIFRDILRVFPLIFGIGVYAWIVTIKDRRLIRDSSSSLLYLLLSASLFAVSFIGRGNINSYINTLLPLALALALLAGWIWGREENRSNRSNPSISLDPLARRIVGPRHFSMSGDSGAKKSGLEGPPTESQPCGRGFQSSSVISLLIIVQFIMLGYLPSQYIPTPEDRLAGERFVAFMKKTEAPILLPFHGYLPQLAGKESSAHWTAVLDLLLAMKENVDDPARLWLDQFTAALEDGRYEQIILDREDWFPELLKLRYTKEETTLFNKNPVFYPVTGYPWRPQFIYNRIITAEKF